jgi:ATP-dependent exoDNAse (exonuclease V) alpha subunit
MESKTKDKTAKKSKNKEKKINNYIIVEDDLIDITDTDILKSGKTSTNADTNVDLDISDKSAPDDKIILTPEQDKIYEEIINFIKNKNENQLLLVGYAGTGKTTMVTKIINDILDTRLCKKIVIVAPTHKAVNIAKSKLFDNLGSDEELSSNINIMTVHRLLNYQSYIDSDTGEKYFAKSSIDPNWTIYDLIVVDECSMLSNQIITDISDQMKNPLNSKLKLIYVGDPAQLPPVNQSDSKIFNMGFKKLELDKIIRTKNNDIMQLSNDHRKWIFSKKNEDIPNVFKYTTDKIKIYSTQEKESIKWLDNFIRIINSKKKKNNSDYDNNIILTWTNKKCNQYNKYIREKLFDKKDLAHFEVGEILIFNDFHRIEIINNTDNENDIDKENVKKEYISFYTSEQVKVISVEKIKYKFEEIKFKSNQNLTQELNDKFKKKIKLINQLINVELDAYKMEIKRISDIKSNDENSVLTHVVYTIHPDSEKTFLNISDEFESSVNKLRKASHKIINDMKKIDNMTKCNYQAEVDKKINKLYRDWQNNVIDKFAQLNYGYSITVHKSQGSTFKNVFIDISDIFDNNNLEETSKCLYTAITRSSNSIELLI